ncbi:MAG TPA: class I SAM-dependent methyltransferase [Spirochaetota bacterium]|nr:class I SAM-dependent methyltransferase [Spirochaetota bacterium]HPL16986.1 class I SAM-dependent methyltransferase [Spirochaetota bacterium]HQJ73146.1 class I SAM-dependent methyltransferase [Spirochaetota bacterium]HRS79233.1 class I SAM-dependent methyltransferase [Spirochaetota bacterium]HRT77174.1 class I SAM-dependent methyltransferase [Spirochaetota bacterium]
MFRDITAPYHALESWLYDRAVAPAIYEMLEERPRFLRPLLKAIPSDGRLLDVGCGGGHLAINLAAANPCWHITGLDLSADQVRRARKRSPDPSGRLCFMAGSAMSLPFADDSFDGLISVCSIKHWPDPARSLKECLRVLRPGCPLVVMEVDPDNHRDDRRAFVARQHVPCFLKPVAMAGFRWKIAARSMPLKDAELLFTALPVSRVKAGPVPGTPLWMIRAVKKRSSNVKR